MRPERIISGGQTGADQAGLRAAKDLGIKTGGWAPTGWRTDAGPNPSLASYGLRECDDGGYRIRTQYNVIGSDGTIIFGKTSAGCRLTQLWCRNQMRPYVWIGYDGYGLLKPIDDTIAKVTAFIAKEYILTLNIAGNRERINPGIEEFVYAVLTKALS